MTHVSRRFVTASLSAVSISSVFGLPAAAQGYPQRPVRVIVPYAAGGASDVLARLVTSFMQKDFGQSMFVDNRGGGASMIGTQAIAAAPADGYTIGIVDTAFTINPGLFGGRVPYDTKRDFIPVSLLARAPLVLVAHESVQAETVQELVALAKSKPGQITLASGGLGTAIHLCCEQFRHQAGIDVILVPYRGGGPAVADVLAGKVNFTFSAVPLVTAHIVSGKLKALGITKSRVTQLPNVPSMGEVGLPGVDAAPEFGMVTPAGAPAEVVTKLANASQTTVKSEVLQQRMLEIGYQPIGSTPDEFRAHIDHEIEKWARIIKAANIKPD